MTEKHSRQEVLKILQKELDRLVDKFGFGKECNLRWIPKKIVQKLFGEERTISGEVVGRDIYVYNEELEEALDTLDHEFFEYIFGKQIIDRYIDAFNIITEAYGKVIEKGAYEDKEALIEIFCNLERKEREKQK